MLVGGTAGPTICKVLRSGYGEHTAQSFYLTEKLFQRIGYPRPDFGPRSAEGTQAAYLWSGQSHASGIPIKIRGVHGAGLIQVQIDLYTIFGGSGYKPFQTGDTFVG